LSLIPGADQTLSETVNGRLEVFLERSEDKKSLKVGLTLKGCVQETCNFAKQVFNNTEIPGKKRLIFFFLHIFG